MTPLEVITAARQFHNAVGDDFWSDAELYNHLYFAATRLAGTTKCIENRWDTTSVAAQTEYEKPTRTITIKRVEFDGRKLEPIDFRELDKVSNQDGTAIQGTPQYYYWFDNVIGLHPTPQTADLTIRTFSYDYPSFPGTSTILEIPVQYHYALVYGVRALMSPKELGHPNTAFYDEKWENAIVDVMRLEQKRKRGDKFRVVLREEDLPLTNLGYA